MSKFSVVLLVVLCSCAGAMTSDAPTSRTDRTSDFLYDPFDPPLGRSIASANAIEKLRSRFGEPIREESNIAKDSRDPTVTVEYLALHYDGLKVQLRGNVNQDQRWIDKIELTGGDHELKYGLGLKVDRHEYESKLIPALVNRKPDSLRFDSSYTDVSLTHSSAVYTDTALIVGFDSNGSATMLTWHFYGD